MPDKTFPFSGSPNQRQTGVNDRRFINGIFDASQNSIARTQEVYFTFRPCLGTHLQPGGASTGRGVHYWAATSTLYSVFGNVIFAGGSTTLAMNTSSGRCWFEETPANTGDQVLIISDGQDNFTFNLSNVGTVIDENTDANYPTNNLGPVVYLDTYLVQAQADGDIWNTRLNSVSSWAASNLTRAAWRGDELRFLHRIGDQLRFFGANSIESFYHQGTPIGSPFLRIQQNAKDFGIAAKETAAWSGETLVFVRESQAQGDGRQVYLMTEGSGKDISNSVINRFLDIEGQSISSATAWMERVGGQLLYCLNLAAANRSWVYNIDNGTWSEWTATSSTQQFTGAYSTSHKGTVYIQGASDGLVSILSVSTFQDNGSAVPWTIQTERISYGTNRIKTEEELSLIADTAAVTVSTSWSDDDGKSFTYPVEIDCSVIDKRITRLGSFRERLYRFSATPATSFRAQGHRHRITVV